LEKTYKTTPKLEKPKNIEDKNSANDSVDSDDGGLMLETNLKIPKKGPHLIK
jgi:hypothetical protein